VNQLISVLEAVEKGKLHRTNVCLRFCQSRVFSW